MTQEQLASAGGLHWTYVGQIERGQRNLTYKNIVRLANGLGITASELVDL
jgi:transcriptional regulator with XRE-family HTH domain